SSVFRRNAGSVDGTESTRHSNLVWAARPNSLPPERPCGRDSVEAIRGAAGGQTWASSPLCGSSRECHRLGPRQGSVQAHVWTEPPDPSGAGPYRRTDASKFHAEVVITGSNLVGVLPESPGTAESSSWVW